MIAKQKLASLIAKDDFKAVLKNLSILAEKYEHKELENDVLFQSGRWESLQEAKRLGTLSMDNERQELAKIRLALLDYVNNLPNDWVAEGIEGSPSIEFFEGYNWKKYAAIFSGIVAILGGIAEFSGYSVKDLFCKEKALSPTQDTIPTNKGTMPTNRVQTSGDKSPAIISHGNVTINYDSDDSPKNKDSK